MYIVINLAKSTLNFIVLNALLAVGNVEDPKFYIGSILAIIAGFTLRIAVDWNNDTISWKKSLIQAIFSLCLCYLSVLFWRDYTPNVKLEYYLFFCSLFSVFIVSVLEKTFKMGLLGYARVLVKKVMAEDTKPRED